MSAIRNTYQRRAHRERGQLSNRERLGLLEKHKDYQARAKDFNKKKATLKSLRAKAAERNEDEFYYGMLSRKLDTKLSNSKKWTGTVAAARGNKVLDVETVRLLKTQDVGYLRTMRNVAAKEVRELEQRAAISKSFATAHRLADGEDKEDEDMDDEDDEELDVPRRRKSTAQKPRKIIFSETLEEMDDAMEPKEATKRSKQKAKPEEDTIDPVESAERIRKKLVNARKKLKVLSDAEHELELQRAMMAKTATVNGFGKNGKVIKVRERKR